MAESSMLALVCTDTGPSLVADCPVPTPAAGEALIAVRLAGICATDIELTRGYKGGYRGVLGHEFVGEVVAAPSAPAWVGRRVVGEINAGCGQCRECQRGLGKHCRRRRAMGISGWDGAFAEYLVMPIANLHSVPDALSDEQAVFVEPLAAAFEILEQVAITPATRVILQGDGRLGLLCALVLATTGCDLTVVGRHPEKLALLHRQGIRNTVLAGTPAAAALAAEPADVVVEATGSASGWASAVELVRPLGTLVLKSTFAATLNDFDISRLVVDEITVVGSRCGPFPRALAALTGGELDVLPLIAARYTLRDGLVALAQAQAKGVLKVLLDMRGS